MHKTGYYTHPECRRHEMGAGHPECPERLDAIQERLLMSGLDIGLIAIEAPAASFDDLALAHDADYIDLLRLTSHRLIEDQSATGPAYAHIDPDTAMNSHTLEAALHSVGAAIAATDAVINGELANAFCAVRPPGHHAMRRKAMGFCFFMNTGSCEIIFPPGASNFVIEENILDICASVRWCKTPRSNIRSNFVSLSVGKLSTLAQ